MRANLSEGFRLRKSRCGGQLEAICWLRSHPLGWELVLDADGTFRRSQACRLSDDVLATTEMWKAALVDRGWQ
jgi:hypothetical protein